MAMFSVVIATYNSQSTLRRTLESLRRQRGADLEILICDGGSTDGTLGIIDEFADMVTFMVSEPDRGVYDAWNKAIPHARGDWVLFLGSDDWLEGDEVLHDLALAIGSIQPDAVALSYVFGRTELKERDGQTIELLGAAPLPSGRLEPNDNPPFSHTGLLHHRSLFAEFGLFDASFRSAGDYEYLMRTAADRRVRFHYVPLTVAQMSAGGLSNNAQGRARHYREILRARQKLGLRPMTRWLLAALLRAHILSLVAQYGGEGLGRALSNCYRRFRGKSLRHRLS